MGDAAIPPLISFTITHLRQLTQRDLQTQWRMSFGDSPAVQLNPHPWESGTTVTLNSRQHIPWPAGHKVCWLGQVVHLPFALTEYPLTGCTVRLALTWWAEQADVYINGQLMQQGDLFDCSARVLLSESLIPDTAISVAIRLVSPGHDDGALVQSQLICEPAPEWVDPGWLADELEVLYTYICAFCPDELPTLIASLESLNWESCQDIHTFNQGLRHLEQQLIQWQSWIKTRCIHWIGHAHLDLAWLWPVAETWEAAERTFTSVLALQQDFAELNFCHSSPALYHWIEQHRPELFAQIQQRVAEGRWEVAAGMWVEPELNLISGESMVRQVLYGQCYTQERFGQISAVAWLPDSFGFCAQLPQILKQGGVDYFLTQKLRWNDTTQFPYEAFWWQSPDGTQIFSVMTPPIGESVDPVRMGRHAQEWEAKTLYPESLWLPGVGDHGGGPTRDMLEVARRLGQSQFLPQLKPSTMTAFCQQVEAGLQDIPVWDDELYLEFHRGCYTSHADQKRYNRRCEHWLAEAELFSAIATLIAQVTYPKAALETAWKQVLFNQFHDILPGSSIPQVFVDANQTWELAQQTALDLREQALTTIATQISLPESPVPGAVPIVVYNSLNWQRAAVVYWPTPTPGMIFDCAGDSLPTDYSPHTQTLSFWAEAIPSIGFRIFWYVPTSIPTLEPATDGWVLDNGHLRVEICESTGNIASIWDYAAQREVLSGQGNVLQFFQDQGQYWDAWNIDPNYAQHPLESTELYSVSRNLDSTVEQWIEVKRRWRESSFIQTYCLAPHSSMLKIETQVDWQNTHVLVKAAFPLSIRADFATYETPCGAIERPTLPNSQSLTDHQKAKWEVPALHWADLTQPGEESYGVSLLNDCKYGYDAQPDCLRLTLLRGSTWPDPECDRGQHQLTYALYPHVGNWKTAHTVQQGYSLNRPLIAKTVPIVTSAPLASLSDGHSFLSMSDESLMLMAFKQSENSEKSWIARVYESTGQQANSTIKTNLPLQYQTLTDGLERPIKQTNLVLQPWQIQSQQWSQVKSSDSF